MPRHLRDVHKMERAKAKAVSTNSGLRTSSLKKEAKRPRTYKRSWCQYPGCCIAPFRMSNHLTSVHKLSIHSTDYRKYLKEAVPVLEHDNNNSFLDAKIYDDDDLETYPDFKISEAEKQSEKMLKDMKKEAKAKGIIQHDIFDSEEDEEFISSESSDSEVDDTAESEVEVQNSNKETDHLLKEFENWLESCDGGDKKLEGAMQQVRQVLTIIQHVDPVKFEVRPLLSRNSVREKWMTPFQNEIIKNNQKRQPGTVRSYCNSLRLFMEFLEITKLGSSLPLHEVRAMQTQARAWGRGLKKRANKKEYEKIYEDYDLLTNPEEVRKFDQSKTSREAVGILEKFTVAQVGVVPTQNEYTLCRDFLMWHLSVDNGARPGQFMSITLSDVENAREEDVHSEDGVSVCRVINVFDHKTADSHGPARVVFSTQVYSWFVIFIKNIRGRFYGLPSSGDSPLFVSHTGNPMQSRNVSGRLTSLWGKGLKEVKKGTIKMNNTLLRKSIQTHVRRHFADMKGLVSNKLLHKESTAERYYNVVRKGEAAASTSQFISKIFKGTTTAATLKGNTETLQDSTEPLARNRSSRWNENDERLVAEVFSKQILGNEITMETVKETLKQRKELDHLKDNPKRVLDKLRYMQKSNPSASLPVADILEESVKDKLSRYGLVEV